MGIKNVHGIEIDIQDESSDSIKELVRGWEKHESDFKGYIRQLEKDLNSKTYIGRIVFEKRSGKYIVRKSNSSF